MICRHHWHNCGPIEFARCGETLRYVWECCCCGKESRTIYHHIGPIGFFIDHVTSEEPWQARKEYEERRNG